MNPVFFRSSNRQPSLGFLFLVVFLFHCPLLGESRLVFPRLPENGSTLSGVAIANPSAQDADVAVTAYGEGGEILATAEITVVAGQQFVQLTTELFGSGLDPLSVGWFEAVSAVDGLTGFFLILDNPLTFFDGADLPVQGIKIVFNHIRIDSGYQTEINVINTEDTPGNLQFQLVSGDTVVVRNLQLAAKGTTRQDVADFFEVQNLLPESYLTVTGDVEVVGFELVRSPDQDVLGLNARSVSEQLTDLYFPQVAVLGDWETSLGVVNYSANPIILTISILKPEGILYDTADLQNNPVTRALNGEESLLEDVAEMFGFVGDQVRDGWLRVEATAPAINGYLTYRFPTSGSLAAVPAVGQGMTRAIFSHIGTSEGFFTGVAVLNAGFLATDLRILALQPDGQILGSFDSVLQPGQRISQLITDLIPGSANQGAGLVWIKTQSPVYLTSLFGTPSVVANIPPQASPSDYLPDSALPTFELDPILAVVEPTGTQVFQINPQSNAVWKVNGIEGGDAEIGIVSGQGDYTAPGQVPSPQVVTVTAEANGSSVGASVDILEKEALIGDLQLVKSVAFLGSLEKLFVAELTLVGVSDSGTQPLATGPLQQGNSEIFEVNPGLPKLTVASFPGETISKMVSFTATNQREYLLLAGTAGGRIIRLDPQTGQSTDVVTGLEAPTSIVLDPISGSLLVAEANQISVVSQTQLEAGLVALAGVPGGPPGEQFTQLFSAAGAAGIAADACTGDVYYFDAEAQTVNRFVRKTGEVDSLTTPFNGGQLLGFHRIGISCPSSFRLLAAGERGTRVWLVNPERRTVRRWLFASEPTDLTFVPRGNLLSQAEAVLVTEVPNQSDGRITLVRTPELYVDRPSNPPSLDSCLGALIFPDPNLERVLKTALEISTVEGERVNCDDLERLRQLVAENEEIQNLEGLANFTQLRSLVLNGNLIRRLEPLASLNRLVELQLSGNAIEVLTPLSGLNGVERLFLNDNSVADLRPLTKLTALNRLELRNNQVSDLRPLVSNEGLATGDNVDLRGNPLDLEDCGDIQRLLGRGVQVQHELECP